MYVILCQLASLCHIMSFCTTLIHSHKYLYTNCARHCASHWDTMIWHMFNERKLILTYAKQLESYITFLK